MPAGTAIRRAIINAKLWKNRLKKAIRKSGSISPERIEAEIYAREDKAKDARYGNAIRKFLAGKTKKIEWDREKRQYALTGIGKVKK